MRFIGGKQFFLFRTKKGKENPQKTKKKPNKKQIRRV